MDVAMDEDMGGNRLAMLLRRYPFALAFGVNLLFYVLVTSILFPVYQTSDDVEAQLTLSGLCSSPEPMAGLRYSNLLIGLFVSALYRASSALPWYGLLLHGYLIIAGTVIAGLLLRGSNPLFRGLLFLFFYIFYFGYFFQQTQFTTASMMMGIAGLLCWLEAEQKSRRQSRLLFLSLVLFLAASLLRWESFLLCFLLGLPIGIRLATRFYSLKNKALLLLLAVCFVLPTATAFWSNASLERDPDWKAYREREKTRVRIDLLDYHHLRYEFDPVIFSRAGWSANDYGFFREWFVADTSVFSLKAFQTIKQETVWKPSWTAKSVADRFTYYFNNLERFSIFSYCLIALLWLAIWRANPNRRLLLQLLLLCFSLGAYLIATRYLPQRVSFPLMGWLLLLGIYYIDRFVRLSRLWLIVLVLLFGAASGMMAMVYLKQSQRDRDLAQKAEQALRSLNPQPTQLFLAGGGVFIEKLIRPLGSSPLPLLANYHFVDFGSYANLPEYFATLRLHRVDQVMTDLINNPQLFIVTGRGGSFLEQFKTFLAEHYEKDIRYELYFEAVELKMSVYRVVSVE